MTLLFALAGCSSNESTPESIASTEQAITTVNYTLPIPVGLSPQDLTLGASGWIQLNDRARAAGPFGSGFGDIAAMGATGTTNIGNLSVARNIWSRPSLWLRGSTLLGYYKAQGTITVQAGTTYGEPEENRSGITIRPDPVWTVTLTGPTAGIPVQVFNGQTTPLGPGNYGSVTVYQGGTLQLQSGNYGFVGFDIEPGANIQMPDPAPMITVTSTLTMHGNISKYGLVLAYLGSQTAHIEGLFRGDYFFAPNADLEIKAEVEGHFFARNITVFEAYTARSVVLTQHGQDLVRPTENVRLLGEIHPGNIEGEIGTTIMTRAMNSSCASDTAFMSHHGNALLFRAVSTIGSGTNATFASIPAAPSPTSCIGPGHPSWDHNPYDRNMPPEPDPPLWSILPGGAAYYSDAEVGTDNLVTRLSGGRVVFAGFGNRYCTDPSTGLPQGGTGCPATLPSSGSACAEDTTPGACIYGSTQCICAPTCAGNGAPCEAGAECCSGSCASSACTAPSPGVPGTYVCGALTRLDEGALGVRMTTDCGSTWTAGAFDPYALGVAGPARGIDRPEIFSDPFDSKLYVATSTFSGTGTDKQVIFSAPTAGVTNASNFTYTRVREDPRDSSLVAMTTILDDKARLTNTPTYGRYVYLASVRCAGPAKIDIETPLGRKSWEVSDPADPSTNCNDYVPGQNGMPFSNIHAGPSIIGVSSVPPRFHIAYTGFNASGFEIINVYSVTLRSTQGYTVKPTIVRELVVDKTAQGQHALWPQLIAPDHLAGSDLRTDTPIILRYGAWGGDTVSEEAVAIYSGMIAPTKTLAAWSLSAVAQAGDALCASTSLCFAGDYRYGSFYQKASNVLTYFTPWSGQASTAGVKLIHAQGAMLDVTP